MNAKAIFVGTSSGSTARLVSRLRPEMPIITLTSNMKVYHQLAVNWGVFPIYDEKCSNVEEYYHYLSDVALERGYVKKGDFVLTA